VQRSRFTITTGTPIAWSVARTATGGSMDFRTSTMPLDVLTLTER
jgi:hypothetical protein